MNDEQEPVVVVSVIQITAAKISSNADSTDLVGLFAFLFLRL